MAANKRLFTVLVLILVSIAVSGCSVTFQMRHRSDVEKIGSLGNEIESLNVRLSQLQEEKEDELSELEKAKQLLEEKLKQEIDDKSVRLEMAEKGLAIKLIASAVRDGDGIHGAVVPSAVPLDGPLGRTDGVLNRIERANAALTSGRRISSDVAASVARAAASPAGCDRRRQRQEEPPRLASAGHSLSPGPPRRDVCRSGGKGRPSD